MDDARSSLAGAAAASAPGASRAHRGAAARRGARARAGAAPWRSAMRRAGERAQWRAVVESSGLGAWSMDLARGRLAIDATGAAMLGRRPEEVADVSLVAWRDEVAHPDDLPALRRALHGCLAAGTREAGGRGFEFDVRARHRDGTWAWLRLRGRALRHDAREGGALLVGTVQDRTAVREAERTKRVASAFVDRLGRIAGVGGWQLDLSSGRLTWTDHALRLLDLDPASGEAPPDLDGLLAFHPAGARARVNAALLAAMESGRGWDLETPVDTAGGRRIWLRTIGEAQVEDGRVVGIFGTLQDITEAKSMAQQLADSERFMRQVTDAVPVRMSYVDADRRYRFANRAACRGLGVEREQLLGRSRDELPTVAAEVDPAAAAHWQAAFAGRRQRFETQDLADGLLTHLDVLLIPDRASDGGVRGLYCLETDITERLRSEERLRRSNDVLQSVLENMPCGISVFDIDLQLVAHNPRFRGMLDLPDALFDRPEVMFEDIIRFNAERGEYGEVDVERFVGDLVERSRHPVPHAFERVRPDGSALEILGSPMPGGGFVTTYVDVTERRRAELRLKEAEAMLRGAIDAVGEAFVLFDPDDRLVYCNDQYQKLNAPLADLLTPGTTFEQLLDASVQRLPDEVGDDPARWLADRLQEHRAGDSTRVHRQQGDGRWLRAIERRMPSGHTVGFRVDVTDLMNATEALERASQSKSRFLANMSHEIRTPMNAILGMLQLLRRTPLSGRQRDYATKSEGAARSLLALLNDILDFSKVEADKMVLEARPFDLDQLMRELAVVLAANAGAKPVELLLDIDTAIPPRLVGDELRLRQVLVNLAGNALKFTEQGEVCVSVALRDRTPAEGAAGECVTLGIQVRDTGIGIAPEHQARIFGGFTQAEASTTRRYGGTGLGLAISQRLVALMGGPLKLESAPGQGSTFSFELTLPVASGETAPRPSPKVRRHALAVGLPERTDELLARSARALGWDLSRADDLDAALSAVAAPDSRIDTVLLDLRSVDAAALGLSAACLRAVMPAAGTRLVALADPASHTRLADRSEDEQAQFDAVLAYPLTTGALAAAVDAEASAREASATAPVAPLAGLRVLLAEDNANNRQIARELLEAEGAIVEEACDGQQAVERVLAPMAAHDVVLMDLQMPVMDGLEATRLIRGCLGGSPLPIVGLTANVTPADREACLAAGMDEHVGKPFDMGELVGLLLRLARPSVEAPALVLPGQVIPDSLKAFAEAAQREGVDFAGAYERYLGRLETWRRSVEGLAESLPGELDTLRTLHAAGDRVEAVRTAHSVKGLAGMVGFVSLARCAAALEDRLRKVVAEDDEEEVLEAFEEAVQGALRSAQVLLT